ncbi:tumor necrosis factor receptor superfamily member 14-like isoform 2-T2 [Menidia menidia]
MQTGLESGKRRLCDLMSCLKLERIRCSLQHTTVFCVSITPGSCCQPKEFPTDDGQCCPMCNEGTFVTRDCTDLLRTQCSNCDPGSYMNRPNGMKKCFLCTPCDPGRGLFVRRPCSTIRDTVCDVQDGFFCKTEAENGGCSRAERHSRCVQGQRTTAPGTSRADTQCEACAAGSFSTDGLNCTLWTQCPEGQIKVKEGSLTGDVVCSSAHRSRPGIAGAFTVFGLMVIGVLIKGQIAKK